MFQRSIVSFGLLAILMSGATAAAQSEEFGKWVSLFNGEDLSGWQNAKPKEQPRSAPGKNAWAVENGTLTNTGRRETGNDLCTVEEFDDYELEIDYKIEKNGNSGVYLRGQIEVQIYDSYGRSDDQLTSADAGALYGGNFVALANAQKKPGEWNTFRVLHAGHRITVWHNGTLIQDNVYQPKPTNGAIEEYPGGGRKLETSRGPIMLQGNHEKVWYRNIRVRPLFERGWKKLWNGEDLSEFTARGHERAKDGLRWQLRDHAFTNTACGGKGHDLWTNGSYGNFLVHYAYMADCTPPVDCGDKSGNSGFYLRDQWEIQILGNQNPQSKHTDGAVYSIYPPSQKASHGANRWNHMDVKLARNKIWVWQNGTLLHDGVVCERRTDSDRPTNAFTKKPFKLQGDHGKVWFSSLYIRELPDGE